MLFLLQAREYRSVQPRGIRDWLAGVLLLGLLTLLLPRQCVAEAVDLPNIQKQRLQRYCYDCHGGDHPAAGLALAQLSFDLEQPTTRAIWRKVEQHLRTGIMPPPDVTRISDEDRRGLTTWLHSELTTIAQRLRREQGRSVLRRLNRDEYQRTLDDLFGIDSNVKAQLPPDSTADGFDTSGSAHHLSAFLLEKYLEAADIALDLAICNRQQPPVRQLKRISIRDAHPVRTTTEDVYRHEAEGTVVCFSSSEWHNVMVTGFYPQEKGRYRFRVSTSAVQNAGQPVTFRITTSGARLSGLDGLIGYFDASSDKPQILTWESVIEPRTTISILPYGLASANTVKQIGSRDWQGPGLAVHFVEVDGPLNDTWPPESHQRLFGDLERRLTAGAGPANRVEVVSESPQRNAEQILKKFLRRAFRRKISEKDVQPFLEIVTRKMAQEYSFEQAIRASLKAVLISPEFLFLHEVPGLLNEYNVAARLAYFLWSSPPDDELLQLADQGQLRRPAILRQQVERLLSSQKSRVFTQNFVGQWLGLRDIDATAPSHLLYPEYDHLLKVSMLREAELFFEELVRRDLSLMNIVQSDFVMLNGRLARHYNIPGPSGWEFERVSLPAKSHRGGVLTMAAVLKVTANGTSTSPVQRGAWVLDRILGMPPAPPPPSISQIDPDIRGATTIREQLARHRVEETCGRCHRSIDPPGFALESFDCIGGWRDRYRVTGNGDSVTVNGQKMPYRLGKSVDASDVFQSQPFEDINGFREILLQHPTQLRRAFAGKIVSYATGRAIDELDEHAFESLLNQVALGQDGVRTLIHAVVQSPLFLEK